MDEGETQCKHACRPYCLPATVLSSHTCWAPARSTTPAAYMCILLMSAQRMYVQACLRFIGSFSLPLIAAWFARHHWWSFHPTLLLCLVHVVDVGSCCCLCCVCVCVSSLQARVKNEILDYKDLAALPKVKAIYEVQQPDLISSSYQPYHRYTSDDRLDTYSYGEVLLPHTPGQT